MAIPRLDGTIRSDHDGLNSGLRFGEAHGGEPDGFDPILLKGIQRLVYTLVIFIIIAVGFAWGKAVRKEHRQYAALGLAITTGFFIVTGFAILAVVHCYDWVSKTYPRSMRYAGASRAGWLAGFFRQPLNQRAPDRDLLD